MVNVSYSPGLIAVSAVVADHSMVPTIWLTVPPCPSGSGVDSGVLVTL